MIGATDPSEMPLKTKQTARNYMPRDSNTVLSHQHSLEIFVFSNIRNFFRNKLMEWQKSFDLSLFNI
jgi:hypothetical protein